MTEHEKLWFPKYWVIRNSVDPRRDDFLSWFNKFYHETRGDIWNYYGYNWTTDLWADVHYHRTAFKNNPTMITLDQREKRTKHNPSQTKPLSPVRSCNYDGKTRTKDSIDWVKITDLQEELENNKERNKEINRIILQRRNLFRNLDKKNTNQYC